MTEPSSLVDVETSVLLDQLDVITAELQARRHGSSPDDELLAALVRCEAHRARFAAFEARVLAEVDARGVAQSRNVRNTRGLLRVLLRLAPGEAKARVTAARSLAPRMTLTGEPVDAEFPQAAQAWRSGAISARHALVIVEAISKIPPEIREEVHDTVEEHLVTTATQIDPHRLAQHAIDLVDALDQDGRLRDLNARARMRFLDLNVRPDGSGRIDGDLTAECMEYLQTVLGPLTKPKASVDGGEDLRTAGQRRHDGLLAALKAGVRAGELPATSGVTTTLILTANAEQWRREDGVAVTSHGVRIPIREGKRWTGADYRMMGVALNERGGIEGWTDSRRLFTESQRLALIARDRGCTPPGCDAPPGHCQAHHIVPHADGGPTTVDNAALLCSWNHANFEELGWRCVMLGGKPHWIAPSWLDPTQTPRRNTMHDP